MATVQETARELINVKGMRGTFVCSFCSEERFVASDSMTGTDAIELADRVNTLAALITHIRFDHGTPADLVKVEHRIIVKGGEW